MAQTKEWTPRHTEVAEYLVVRGVTMRAIGDLFGFHANTVAIHLADASARKLDYQTTLIRNCKADFDALGISVNDALAAVLGEPRNERDTL